jgi:hypothetical protein
LAFLKGQKECVFVAGQSPSGAVEYADKQLKEERQFDRKALSRFDGMWRLVGLIKGKLRAKYVRARDKLQGQKYSYPNTFFPKNSTPIQHKQRPAVIYTECRIPKHHTMPQQGQ